MARRGFGSTALRAALGAVTGVAEGLQQRDVVAAEKKRMADAASRQAMLDEIALADKNFVEKGVREGLVRQATPAIGNAIRTAQAAMSGNITDAQPVDFSSLGKAAGMYGDTPAASVTLGGKTFQRMQNPIQASLMAAEQAATQARGLRQEVAKENAAKAAADARAKAEADKASIDELVESGMTRSQAVQALRLDAKYGDINKTPSVKATERGQDISAATARQDREVAKEKAGGTSPANEIEKRLPVGARNDIADYNAAIRTLQEAEKEVANNPKAFGLMPVMYAKGGILGRAIREKSEGEKSEAYTKARAQMQSALMKLRKTQFGTQMTKLEKDTGEEVFPSGAESSERLTQMLSVLIGNAEQLRRGVYEANNAPDLYTPIAPDTQAPPASPPAAKPATAGSGGRKPVLTIDQWMDANPQRTGEDDKAYLARGKASTGVQ